MELIRLRELRFSHCLACGSPENGRKESMMACAVVAVKIGRRSESAPKVQEVLTRYGCIIMARMGIHELSCQEEGLILLVVCGTEAERAAFLDELKAVPSVTVRAMEL